MIPALDLFESALGLAAGPLHFPSSLLRGTPVDLFLAALRLAPIPFDFPSSLLGGAAINLFLSASCLLAGSFDFAMASFGRTAVDLLLPTAGLDAGSFDTPLVPVTVVLRGGNAGKQSGNDEGRRKQRRCGQLSQVNLYHIGKDDDEFSGFTQRRRPSQNHQIRRISKKILRDVRSRAEIPFSFPCHERGDSLSGTAPGT